MSKAKKFAAAHATEPESIVVLRRRIADQEREIAKLRGVQQIIEDAVESSAALIKPLRVELAKPRASRHAEEIACLHVSDTQIGKRTKTYDVSVARSRLLMLAKKTAKIAAMRRTMAKITDLRIYLGGDIIEGEDIFPGQAHEIEQSVYDQAIHSAPTMLAEMIGSLAPEFASVKVLCVTGNHGRNGRYGAGQHPKTNWDRVAYVTLSHLLRGNKAVGIEISEEFYAVDSVFSWGNLIVHGDQITGGFAGFPLYGTAKKAWGWIDSIPAPWDYLWFGHFHTYAMGVLNRRIYLANGTTESDNVYAQQNLAAAGVPCQRLAFFNAEHGLVADHQIYLDRRSPARARAEEWTR